MLKFITILIPINGALTGQLNAIITMVFDLSILSLLIFPLNIFSRKVRKRISELKELTNQPEQKVELRRDGQLPQLRHGRTYD